DTDSDTDADTDSDSDTDADTDTDSDSDSDMTAAQIAADMKIGWNLGNSLDAPEGETAWSNPVVTQGLITAVANAGFGVVRIPVTWSLHMSSSAPYTIDSSWMARVEEVVGYVLNAGMYAIINVHHDGADGYSGVEWLTLDGPYSTVEARFTAVWQQISAQFQDYDQHLLFESMNEIHDGYPGAGSVPSEDYAFINNLNQAFVDTVRASGGNNAGRVLIVPGYNTNIDLTLDGFSAPSDSASSRMMLAVHFYDPWSFAGEASTHVWGTGYPGTDSWGQEDFVTGQFDKLKNTYVNNGIPVIIGEYGAVNQSGYETYRRYYMEYVTKAAYDRGIVPVYWDNNSENSGAEAFGLMRRSDNTVMYPTILDAMMRAVNNSYSIGDIAKP
ncbi:MAG: glycoside hydrolase family 5 protein, partial [Deltaproteobacteria bacterium]|nr:glycoside hydrolase family 5 protein [Deltaproteobacteria bacterium]